MTSISGSELTQDAFLGGRVLAWQPKSGFRAGVDSVLIAAACAARAGETVLELGCGPGVAALCLQARVQPVRVTGLELQSSYAEIARRNGLTVVEGDVAALPDDLRRLQFHHVFFNPPYFDPSQGQAAPDAARQIARAGQTPLAAWFAAAEKRLRPRGTLTVIQRTSRLPEMLSLIGPTLGSVEVLPVAPRRGHASHLALLRAQKDGRAPFRLHAPLILHAAAQHEGDHPDYTAQIAGILQNGDPLPFPA